MATNKPKKPLTDEQIRKDRHISPDYAFSYTTVICPRCKSPAVLAFYAPGSMLENADATLHRRASQLVAKGRFLMCSKCEWKVIFPEADAPVINKSDIIQ